MQKAKILAAIIVLSSASLGALQTAHPGVKLLENLNALFDRMSEGQISESEGTAALDKLMDQAAALRESGRLEAAFMKRFHRLLLVLRLSFITDRKGILRPLVDREFGSFVKDATGKTYDPEAGATQQIALFAEAVNAEILSLYGTVREK